jgi:hypothetical protein
LEAELERLKKLLLLGHNLTVAWKPSINGTLSGEVKNDTIYIYDHDEERAIETLRHEFLDYCLSQAIEPYRKITNMLIRKLNEDAYGKKEKLVETLTKLLHKTKPEVEG